jgi:hypothetical protein
VRARHVAALLGVLTMAGATGWMLLYLARWEWHRAITAGIFAIAAELALVGGAVLTRLGRLEERVDRLAARQPGPGERDHAAAVLAETRPSTSTSFRWLEPDPDRTSVFVPILMGTGFLLTGVAWAVERLARATAAPVLERDLAGRLAVLAPTVRSLVPPPTPARPSLDPTDPGARLARPDPRVGDPW